MVQVHHTDLEVARILIGIPETQDVVPGIDRGKDGQGEHHHQCSGGSEQARQIALEHPQDALHPLPPSIFSLMTLYSTESGRVRPLTVP